MEEDGRRRVRAHCTTIKENIRAKDIVTHLFQANVLSSDQMERVQLPLLTTEDGMLKLIVILLKIPGSFEPFCNALRATNSDWLVDAMMQTDVSNLPNEPNPTLVEMDAQLNVDSLVQQLSHQAHFIEMLLKRQTSTQDSADGKPRAVPIEEMPELKQAMEANDLSEREVIKYIDYLAVKRLKPDSDATDSCNKADRRRSMTASSHNFTETVALTTAVDIISYLSCSEGNTIKPPKTKYEATMRRTVSELITNHKQVFEQYINRIKNSRVTGIDFLFNVADEIFRDNQHNWGRIAALYAFCGWLAKHDLGVESKQPHQAIGEFLGYYVSQKLGVWIDDNGGWDSFLDQFPEGSHKKDDFWTMSLFGLGVAAVAAATIAIASRQ